MSFRKFGGLQYSGKNTAVSSTFSTVSNLSVTTGVGQANSGLQVFSNFTNDVTFDGKVTFNNKLIGQTGSFEYLKATNLSFEGVAGKTGSFTYISSSDVISGPTASFSYINNVNVGAINKDLSFNTFLGTNAFSHVINNKNTTNAQSNTAIGYQSLQQDISGSFNTGVGVNSLQKNTYGNKNTAVGWQSLQQDVSGNSNTAIGSNAGNNLTQGDYNTFLGTNADYDFSYNKYQYSTAIGYNALIDASNQIVLGGTGTQGYPSVKIPGNYLGIGGVYGPTGGYTLDVSGNARISGSLKFDSGDFRTITTGQGITAPFLESTSYVSGVTGSFNYIVASQGITGSTISSDNNISAPRGTVSGLTGTFNYLVAREGITGSTISSDNNISAPAGTVSGLTGSFTYLVAREGISGYTGAFTYLTASTGSFNYVQSSIFNATSDYRIKKDVQSLDETFVVDKINPVIYNNVMTNNTDLGLIAHEVQELYPYLVNGTKNGDVLQSVNYIGLIPILIREMKQLKERVKKLEEHAKI